MPQPPVSPSTAPLNPPGHTASLCLSRWGLLHNDALRRLGNHHLLAISASTTDIIPLVLKPQRRAATAKRYSLGEPRGRVLATVSIAPTGTLLSTRSGGALVASHRWPLQKTSPFTLSRSRDTVTAIGLPAAPNQGTKMTKCRKCGSNVETCDSCRGDGKGWFGNCSRCSGTGQTCKRDKNHDA